MAKKTKPNANKRPKRLTMTDIAKMAGVDVSTVSRTLADSPRLPLATKEKIRKIVKETGYIANHKAQTLQSQKSGQILVMHYDNSALTFPEFVQGIEESAREFGVNVLVGSYQNEMERKEALGRLFLSGAVDGIILLTGEVPECVENYEGHEQSVVSVSRPIINSDIPYVATDITDAAVTAIEHLLSLGHKNIAHISGPKKSDTFNPLVDGYSKAMKKAGNMDYVHIERADGFDMDSGSASMTSILAGGHQPTAVFCATDELAFGAMKKARQAGFKIPEDMSFVGYNDVAIAKAMVPPLTSIRVPLRELGRIGARMLLESLKSEGSIGKNQILKYELMVRGSCGPAQNPKR